MTRKTLLITFLSFAFLATNAQNNPGSNHGNKFEDLNYLLPTPNEYRTASGTPGPRYWQQRADYDMAIEVDEAHNILTGNETVTYFNNSPNPLTFLWLQVDENIHHPNSDNNHVSTSRMNDQMSDNQLSDLEPYRRYDGYGVNITRLVDAANRPLKYTINQTMMRIEMPEVLRPGQKFVFKVDWNYKINDKLTRGGRGGYEHFAEDGNNLYSITQFYPRMAVYSDFQGWQTGQFTGGAEFALSFGNFKMRLTVPADHIIAATGECQNYKSVLTGNQYQRWLQAHTAKEPVEIVTLAEALAASKQKSAAKKTWIYEARDVRDVAFNTSRRLVWDAMPTVINGKRIMSMSYYGKEAYPIYRKYSTKVVDHTLKVYSKFTIPYPYPVAISVEAANGMEYPMLAMNNGRADKDGTYSEAVKNAMIGVTIHEVGHNFFPMIVNSDERQYWWMDEGLNSFCQFLAEQEWDPNFPSRRGPIHKIVDYMKMPKNMIEPIMTKGDAIVSVGNNAYGKASTGLNILRETIMGREAFDYAFKQYAQRWAFKHPTPADLFRTMEDASAIDLDWFWRGWYFSTDPVDISLDSVKWFKMNDKANATALQQPSFKTITELRNAASGMKYAIDTDTTLRDFYYMNPDPELTAPAGSRRQTITPETDAVTRNKWVNKNFYQLTFSNKGGLIMPIIIEWTYKDGTKELEKIPVTIWRLHEDQVTKVFVKDKEVTNINLDPYKQTADIDEENGMWPLKKLPSRFELFKQSQETSRGQSAGGNTMQRAQQRKSGE